MVYCTYNMLDIFRALICPSSSSQSSQWKHSSSPRPKKARQVRSNVKVMLTAFFDSRGVVHHEYAPQGQSTKSTTGMSSVTYVMLCGARDRTCGQQEIGASITTLLQHIPRTSFRLFWQKTRLLCFNRLLTLLIWPPATSGCSANSRGH